MEAQNDRFYQPFLIRVPHRHSQQAASIDELPLSVGILLDDGIRNGRDQPLMFKFRVFVKNLDSKQGAAKRRAESSANTASHPGQQRNSLIPQSW